VDANPEGGFEMFIPKDFDCRRSCASFQEWTGLGLLRPDDSAGNKGADWPRREPAVMEIHYG